MVIGHFETNVKMYVQKYGGKMLKSRTCTFHLTSGREELLTTDLQEPLGRCTISLDRFPLPVLQLKPSLF